MSETPDIDRERIKRALREYHAANNSAARAARELAEALPVGVEVLIPVPGKPDLFWTYERSAKYGVLSGADRYSAQLQKLAVIIDAPGPCDELLPRLVP